MVFPPQKLEVDSFYHPKWWFFTRNTGISLVEIGIDSSQTGILLSYSMDWGVASLDKHNWIKLAEDLVVVAQTLHFIHHIYLRLSQNDTSFFLQLSDKAVLYSVVIWVCPNIGYRIPYHSWWRTLSGNQTWAGKISHVVRWFSHFNAHKCHKQKGDSPLPAMACLMASSLNRCRPKKKRRHNSPS